MNLKIFILAIILMVLIYISSLIKQKTLIYFICVLLILLSLRDYLQNKENFENVKIKEAIDKVNEAVVDKEESDKLNKKIKNLEETLSDLTKIVREQNLNKEMDRGAEATNFSMTESQKVQDNQLEMLEKEVDILLKLYKKQNQTNEEDKYKTLPIFSSCKVSDLGQKYQKPKELVKELLNADKDKNLGFNSDTANQLGDLLDEDMNETMDFNIKLN